MHRRRCLRRVGVAVQLPSSGFRGSGGEVSARDGVGWGRMGVDGGGGETEDFFWDDGDGMAKMVCDWMRLES